MDRNDIPDSALARIALDSIPTPKDDAKDIVGLVKSSGRITGYQLSDGSTVSKEDGVALAKDGEIKGVGIAHRKDTEYLNLFRMIRKAIIWGHCLPLHRTNCRPHCLFHAVRPSVVMGLYLFHLPGSVNLFFSPDSRLLSQGLPGWMPVRDSRDKYRRMLR